MMKTRKSEQDLLLDQTLALLKAAIADQAKSHLSLAESSGAFEESFPQNIPTEIIAEKALSMEHDSLIERTLSIIEHVADGEAKESGSAREAKHPEVVDEIGRMALDLDTLKKAGSQL
jgi:hypothetical protein